MERVSLRLPEGQIEELDALVQDEDYPSRSEAIRAAIRELTTGDPPTARIVRENGQRARGSFEWGERP